MKKNQNIALRGLVSAALGLAIAISATATSPAPSQSGPQPSSLSCASPDGPNGAIASKTCSEGCSTLNPGCCQTWSIEPYGGGDDYSYKFCAGTYFQCNPPVNGYANCKDASGNPAQP